MWYVILLLAFAQNLSFSLVSRSRNRDKIYYHLVAVSINNVLFFLTFRELVMADLALNLMLPYVIGTALGSVLGIKVSMKIESWLGATADGHLKNK